MDENFERSQVIDFAFFVESLYFYTELIGNKASQTFRKFVENMQIEELVDSFSDNVESHPILKFLVLATSLCFAVPVVLFIIFAVFSAVITFTTFLLIEGTILVLGGLSMCVCLLFMIMCITAFVMSLGIIYLLTVKLGHFLNNFNYTSFENNSLRLDGNEVFQVQNNLIENVRGD